MYVEVCNTKSEEYSETYQTFAMKLLAKLINCWKLFTNFATSSMLDVLQGSGYVSGSKVLKY